MTTDQTQESLIELAAEVHPWVFATSIPELNGLGSVDLLSTIYANPKFSRCVESFVQDPDLGIVKEDGSTAIWTTIGHASTIHREMLPFGVLSPAARRVVAEGGDQADLGAYEEAVIEQLNELRRLLAGEEVTVPHLAGFAGLTVVGDEIESCIGRLRNSQKLERSIRPFGISATAVLENQIDVRYVIGQFGSLEFEPYSADASTYSPPPPPALEWTTKYFPLAVLLAAYKDGGSPVAVPAWTTYHLPGFAFPGFHLSGRPLSAHVASGELTSDDNLSGWLSLIIDHDDESIHIARRRTVSAAQGRHDPEDGLIDAVMAWENLFGSGESAEVSFRVTAALSSLLEPDPTERRTMQKRLAKLYSLRSRIVHGAQPGRRRTLEQRRQEALDVSVKALRALFSERPDLIGATDRGFNLLFGSPVNHMETLD